MRESVAAVEWLTPEDVRQLLPSGRQPVFTNRISWAIVYLGVRSRNGKNRTLSGAVLKLVVFRFSSNSNRLSDL